MAMFRACHIYSVIGVLSSGVLFAQIELKPVLVLDLAAIPEVGFTVGSVLDGVRLDEDVLHISFSTGRGPMLQKSIITLSRLGSLLSKATLPTGGTTSRVVFDRYGTASLLRWNRDRMVQMERYQAGGKSEHLPLFSATRDLAVFGQSIVTLNSDGILAPLGTSPSVRSVRVPGLSEHVHFTSLDDHTIALVDSHTAQMTIADLVTGIVNRFWLETPEIRDTLARFSDIQSRTKSAHFSRPVLFLDSSSDANGRLFLALAPGQVSKGILLLQVDRGGRHVQTVRLLPENVARLRRDENPEGWALLRRVSISTDSTVAAVSPTGIVLMYSLK